MTDLRTPVPKPSSEQAARREREADALRENLRRRKEQARARQDPKVDSEPSPAPELPEPPLMG